MASRFEISQQIYNSAYAMHSAHSHSYYELYYLMNGSCNMFIHDNTYRMEAGTILFIPDNVLHKTTYLNNAYHERLYIEFTDDYISDLIDIQGFEQFKDTFYMHFFSIPDNHRHEFLSIFSVLINERQNSNALSPCVYKNYLQNLLILLCRYCDNKPASPASLVDTVSIADVSVQKAMNYITVSYTHLTLPTIA